MKPTKKILILPGDGVGPEVCEEAVKVLKSLSNLNFNLELDFDLIGGASIAILQRVILPSIDKLSIVSPAYSML